MVFNQKNANLLKKLDTASKQKKKFANDQSGNEVTGTKALPLLCDCGRGFKGWQLTYGFYVADVRER